MIARDILGEADRSQAVISLDERFPAYFLGSEGCGKLVQA
jgi:hypothetical protein